MAPGHPHQPHGSAGDLRHQRFWQAIIAAILILVLAAGVVAVTFNLAGKTSAVPTTAMAIRSRASVAPRTRTRSSATRAR